MKKVFWLMFIIILTLAVFNVSKSLSGSQAANLSVLTEAEAAAELEESYITDSNIIALENAKVTDVNTTSEIAEQNDRGDFSNDSTIKSKFGKQADGSLSLHIKQKLLSNLQLSGKIDNVYVIAVDGRVTLEGSVNSEEVRENIVLQVDHVAGVDSVDNQLTIEDK